MDAEFHCSGKILRLCRSRAGVWQTFDVDGFLENVHLLSRGREWVHHTSQLLNFSPLSIVTLGSLGTMLILKLTVGTMYAFPSTLNEDIHIN